MDMLKENIEINPNDNATMLNGIEITDQSANCELFNGVEISKLTKSQRKKYLRMKKWEAAKKEKRANERLKAKKRKVDAKMNNIDTGPSRKQLKSSTMKNSSCKIGVVIDLSFDEFMISKVWNFMYNF